MGLLDSDYKPHGSISNNQLIPQRHHKDTYFGELVLSNMKTGENIADNIRYDILQGITARLRLYNKKGKKLGFNSFLTFPQDYDVNEIAAIVAAESGRPVDSLITGFWSDEMEWEEYSNAELSRTQDLHYEDHIDAGTPAIGRIETTPGNLESFTAEITITYDKAYLLTSGVTYHTGLDGTYYTPVAGYYAEYISGGKQYFFYSINPILDAGTHSIEYDLMPIVPLQDNGNGERPYETRPWAEDAYANRKDVLRRLDVDFATMSRQVIPSVPAFGSDEWNLGYGYQWSQTNRLQEKYSTAQAYYDFLEAEIAVPAFGSSDWNSDYGRTYKDMMRNCERDKNLLESNREFCEDYPTEQIYHDELVADKEKAGADIDNVTDAHFGFMASAKLLDESNVVALYYTLAPILPNLAKVNATLDPLYGLNHDYESDGDLEEARVYKFGVEQGSFIANYSFDDWSMVRRYGVADPVNYPPGVKSAKYKHPGHEILEDTFKILSDGPELDMSYEGHRPPDGTYGTQGMIELRVQDRPDEAGNPRYLEMRLYSPFANHKVDVIKDGEHGKSGEVLLYGGLKGINEEYDEDDEESVPYSDVLCYVLSYEAIREVPIFLRERLIREAMIVRVSAIKMQEIKWYQQGWFKIVMIIAAVALAYFTGGQSIVALLEALAVNLVIQILLSLVDNPILRAVLQIIAIVYGGYNAAGGFALNPAMLVEASGTLFQTKIALEAQALGEKAKEFAQKISENKKKFDEIQKVVGNDQLDKNHMLYVIGLTPTETHEELMARALNSHLPSIESDLILNAELGTPS